MSTAEKRRLVILVQFDPDGGLPAFVRIHLERLRPIAGALVLVSNSQMTPASQNTANAICDRVIVRKNIGLDFAGWRDALSCYEMDEWDEVLLTNSSIVGPFFPLAPIIQEMDSRDGDFWGMVHSLHTKSHLQSYFLLFKRKIILSSAWENFWKNVADEPEKRRIIRRYEVGLSQTLMQAGFTYASYISDVPFPASIRMVHIDRLKSAFRIPFDVNRVNRTVELHDELIADGMPYLKASLLWGKDTYRCKPIAELKALTPNYPWADLGF